MYELLKLVWTRGRDSVKAPLTVLLLGALFWAIIAPTTSAQGTFRAFLPLIMQSHDGVVVPFGIEATGLTPATAPTIAARLKDTGTTWTRFNAVKWSVVEPTRGATYDWQDYDQTLAVLGDSGLRTVLVISTSPDWASVDHVNLPSGPIKADCLPDFARFVQAAVSRYSAAPYNITHFEFFNEPDGTSAASIYSGIIGTWGDYGAEYANMLETVYPAVKAANPSASVVFGGLAYSGFVPDGPFNRSFLDDVLNAGGGQYFDVFNFHYYAIQTTQWDADGIDIIGKTRYLREKLRNYGLSDKPMICTELGTFGTPGDAAQLETQAQYVAKVHARGMAADLKIMHWYSLYRGTDHTGLIENDVAKPAYQAYQVMTSQLANARFVRKLPAEEMSLTGPGATVFEGYAFRNVDGRSETWLAWLNGNLTATLSLTSPRGVTVMDKMGATQTISADSTGTVTISVGESPIFIVVPH